MDLATLVVKFMADISGFSTGVSAVQQMMGGLGQTADQTSQSFGGRLVSGVKSAYDGFMNFGEGLAHTVEGITEMNFPLMNMVQGLVSSDAQMEQTDIAFTTLLHSSKAAGDYLNQLWNFAAKTPFQFKDLAMASQQMIATGFAAKDTIPDLTQMGNALSAMGRTSAGDLMQLTSIFDRMEAGTKVNARDMQELTFMGINGWGDVAKAMHLTVAQVQEMSKKGTLLAKDVIPDLLNGFNKTFGGAMQAQALTFNGLLTTVKDNLQLAWRTISGPLFDAAKKALEIFGNLVASVNFQNMAKGIASVVGAVFGTLGNIGSILGKSFQGLDLGPVTDGIQNVVATFKMAGDWITHFYADVTRGGAAFQPLINGIHSLLQSGINTLGSIFQTIYVAFNAVVVGFATGQGPLGWLQGAFKEIASIVGGQLSQDFKTFVGIGKDVSTWFGSTMMPILKQAIPPLVSIGKTVLSDIVPSLLKLFAAGHQISDAVMPMLIHGFEFIAPILAHVAVLLLDGIALALKVVGPLFTALGNAVSGLANFFTKTEVGGALLKATLITLSIPVGILTLGLTILAVQAIAQMIITFPAWIAGNLGVAASAWTAAAGVIAMTWPILAVIAAIAIIILIVTHWGQIMSWLGGVFGALGGILGNFFGMIGGAIGNFFSMLGTKVHEGLSAVGNFFTSLFSSIGGAIGGFFSGLGSKVQQGLSAVGNFFSEAWNKIVGISKAVWSAIVEVVQMYLSFMLAYFTAPFRAIGALFSWLYDHNYYFQRLVDTINTIVHAGVQKLVDLWNGAVNGIIAFWNMITRAAQIVWAAVSAGVQAAVEFICNWIHDRWDQAVSTLTGLWNTISGAASAAWNAVKEAVTIAVSFLVVWVQDQWERFTGWITDKWNGFKGIASDAWKAVENTFQQYIMPIVNFAQDQWNRFTGWLQDQWNKFSGYAKTAWDNVTSKFSAAWGAISSALTGLWNNISTWFSNLANQALQWGANIVNQIANGIRNAAGAVGSAVSGVAGSIAKNLGFHSPTEEGPGKDSDKWAPNLIRMFSQGLAQGKPSILAALQTMISPLVIMNTPGVGTTPYSGISGGANGQQQIIQIFLDGNQIGQILSNRLTSNVRLQTGIKR